MYPYAPAAGERQRGLSGLLRAARLRVPLLLDAARPLGRDPLFGLPLRVLCRPQLLLRHLLAALVTVHLRERNLSASIREVC